MKIHFVSNSLRMNSGFGNVSKYLILGLRELGHDVTMSGIQTAYCSGYSYGIEQLPLDTKFVDEGTQLFLNTRKVNADIVIYVGQLDADLNFLTKIFSPTLAYIPVEGRNIPDKMVNDIKFITDHGGIVVPQCFYGYQEMSKVGLGISRYIYHGWNDKIFKPIGNMNNRYEVIYCYFSTDVGKAESDPVVLYKQGCYGCKLNNVRKQEKCAYFKEETISILKMIDGKWAERDIGISKLINQTSGKFVFGHVGQNFGLRKRQERLVRAYAILINDSKQMRDNTVLHLHCKPIAMDGINLIKEVSKLGISENVIFSYGSSRSNAWTEQGMNILYNTFDVNVSASSSEGFCIPVLEGFAVGVPMIASYCSSFTELIGNDKDENKNRGWLAEIESWQMIVDSSERALVSEKDLALKMKLAYTNNSMREKFSKNCIDFASDYTWDKIVGQFNKILVGIK